MSLHTALNLLLEEYPTAMQRSFAANATAGFVRREIPKAIASFLSDDPRYLIEGSAGKGNWASTPWVAVLDRFVTESAQDGYYLVYLARENFSGIYLSLNQGVTSVRRQYGTKTSQALKVRAADYLARLGSLPENVTANSIDLPPSRLSSLYEAGSICSILYQKGQIPQDGKLAKDLQTFLNLYLLLTSKESQLFWSIEAEDDEFGLLEENLIALREHKRIERNRTLSSKAKKIHGYRCKACGFDFAKVYGEIGQQFIEAHHLSPLAMLKGQRIRLDPRNDFTVLCSNCHRMIHRTSAVGNVEDFKVYYRAKGVKAHESTSEP